MNSKTCVLINTLQNKWLKLVASLEDFPVGFVQEEEEEEYIIRTFWKSMKTLCAKFTSSTKIT